ncbi:MAG: pentapeptide repeat-containing protein, partial [Proteobacteria bacterium]|nr:pentapeptide repeat-containing protein [Pseudomonadota bacterium]
MRPDPDRGIASFLYTMYRGGMTYVKEKVELIPAEKNPWVQFAKKTRNPDFFNKKPFGWHWFWGIYFLHRQLPEFPEIQAAPMSDLLPDEHWLKKIDDKFYMKDMDLSTRELPPRPHIEEIYNTILQTDIFAPLLLEKHKKTILLVKETRTIDLSNLQFDRPLDLSGFIFPLNVSFAGSESHSRTGFVGTLFYGEADFTNTKFASDTTFKDTIFHSKIKFDKAEFSNPTVFNKTKFLNYVTFKNATFANNNGANISVCKI